jgi:predicted tellurium resistance membrane protein TerC
MTLTQIEALVATLTAIGGLIFAIAGLVWFLSEQFKRNRSEFWKAISELHNTIVGKMDTHEKEDDRRFEALTTQIWHIELRNARRDGIEPPRHPGGNGG